MSWVFTYMLVAYPRDIARIIDRYFYRSYDKIERRMAQTGDPAITGQIEDANAGLYGACRGGHEWLAKQMIERGANKFTTALAYAYRGRHEHMQRMMRQYGADESPYGDYKRHKAGDMSRRLNNFFAGAMGLDIGAGISPFGDDMHGACYGGHIEMVKAIVEKLNSCGALYRDVIQEGFEYACIKGHVDCARLMLEYGAVRTAKYYEDAMNDGRFTLAELIRPR